MQQTLQCQHGGTFLPSILPLGPSSETAQDKYFRDLVFLFPWDSYVVHLSLDHYPSHTSPAIPEPTCYYYTFLLVYRESSTKGM